MAGGYFDQFKKSQNTDYKLGPQEKEDPLAKALTDTYEWRIEISEGAKFPEGDEGMLEGFVGLRNNKLSSDESVDDYVARMCTCSKSQAFHYVGPVDPETGDCDNHIYVERGDVRLIFEKDGSYYPKLDSMLTGTRVHGEKLTYIGFVEGEFETVGTTEELPDRVVPPKQD